MFCETCERDDCICSLRSNAHHSDPFRLKVHVGVSQIEGVKFSIRENLGRGVTEVRIPSLRRVWLDAPDAAEGLAWAKAQITRSQLPAEPEPARGGAPGAPPPEPVAPVAELARRPCVTIYTDGSNYGTPGPGGAAALLVCSGQEREVSVPIESATNNIAELTAVIIGLRALTQPCRVKIVSDSQYVVQGLNGLLPRWAARGWRTATHEPVKNQPLWELLLELMAPHAVIAEWVRGHAGHPQNERVDALARSQAQAEKGRQDARLIARAGLASKPAICDPVPKRLQWLCEPEARADYHAVIGGPITRPAAKVLSAPWRLGGKGGPWVTGIEGETGCISVDALTKIKAPKRQKVKA
jgi:ribonuclease HI